MIYPDWPAPANVRAVASTRVGGCSEGPYAWLNLGGHVGDAPRSVAANRRQLVASAALPADPAWLDQVHGKRVAELTGAPVTGSADAAITGAAGVVCVVLTADCLPVLLCDRAGTRVAAVHAGWRGLAAGILGEAVAAFARGGVPAQELLVWLGPGIGQAAYEVGDEVRQAFGGEDAAVAFAASSNGRWQCDLYGLARRDLRALGVSAVAGGNFCTHTESDRFFSYRRDGQCGRQATLIWLDPV